MNLYGTCEYTPLAMPPNAPWPRSAPLPTLRSVPASAKAKAQPSANTEGSASVGRSRDKTHYRRSPVCQRRQKQRGVGGYTTAPQSVGSVGLSLVMSSGCTIVLIQHAQRGRSTRSAQCSFFMTSPLTALASAWPFVARITAPMIAPIGFILPLLSFSTMSGLSASAWSTAASSAPVSWTTS